MDLNDDELENEIDINDKKDEDEDIIEYYMSDKIETTAAKNVSNKKIETSAITTTTLTSVDDQHIALLSNKVDRLCEFVLVLLHSILYKINYYNEQIGVDRKQ